MCDEVEISTGENIDEWGEGKGSPSLQVPSDLASGGGGSVGFCCDGV